MKLLCDAMLGRLARDLRLLGIDTAYASPTATDDEVLAQARREGRALLTKDKALAARANVRTVFVGGEDELANALDALELRPRRDAVFTRCTDCNGLLFASEPRAGEEVPPHVGRVSRCVDCGHLYWAGSHVGGILARLERYLAD